MRSNTASQPSSSTQPTQHQNQRYTNSYYPDKNESYDQFNNIQSKNFKRYHYQPYKKRLSPKMNLSPYTLPILQLSLLSPYLVYQSLLQQQNLTISFLKTIQKIQRHIQDSN